MSYHSKLNNEQPESACGFPLLPIQQKDAYNADVSTHDCVDEAIAMFRANILFKNYKIGGAGDKIMVFLTAFIQKCLEQMFRFPDQERATRVCDMIIKDPQALDVGSDKFFLNKLGLLTPNANGMEQKKLKDYLKKAMEECAKRLLECLYRPNEGDLNRKYWIGLAKKPFLGHKFTEKQYQM